MIKKSFFIGIFFLIFAQGALAQRSHSQSAEPPLTTWDLGAAFGSYYQYSYSELALGLTYRFRPPFAWRNTVWDRIGNNAISTAGVDSSIRYELYDFSQDLDLGFRFFVGPGLRLASGNFSGYFGEVGILFRLGGLNVGVAYKALTYWSPGKDPNTGSNLPVQDNILSLIIAGGGAF
jgi:hypothetical protein